MAFVALTGSAVANQKIIVGKDCAQRGAISIIVAHQKVLKVVGNVRILPVIRICLHLAKLK